MSDPVEDVGSESLMEKINDKIHNRNDSSSSDSESEKYLPSRKNRLFGRQKPVHDILGGGKSADVILWRNKQISACIVAGVTVIWLIFEWMGYHLLTFVCHSLILALATLFIWTNFSSFINKSPPKFPEVILPEDLFMSIALLLRHECNEAFATFREVASGNDLKKFLMVIAALWVLSVVGSWFNFLTLFYMVFVLLHTVPVLYEKHEDHVDTFAEKAMVEINKQYAVLDAKVLQKLPKLPFNKDNKQH
ncbi:reticulon-like protein B5 [Telopea speciosissima]|uniref:reticulon-like protein B5 n=1 Tax=Telopea speciosissima TaxID=54955 RepID=UPI001CC615B2|nr:reticulon-like protein B5 [Telopea speciosissima]